MPLVDRTCEHCAKSFQGQASNPGKYCSRECKYAAQSQPLTERFWTHVDKTGVCWVWTAVCSKRGYGQIRVSKPKRTHLLTHRVSYELHFGPIPDGLWVLHNCDNPSCVRPDHLFLGTAKDNTQDMLRKGRHQHGDTHYSRRQPEKVVRGERHGWTKHPEKAAKGEQHGCAKLTEPQVREMRRRWAAREASQRQLMVDFSVSRATVQKILSRHLWKHLE
jgi:hypothetical protein